MCVCVCCVLCVCVCMYMCMCVCAFVLVCVLCVCVYVCTCACVYVHLYLCVCCVCVCVYVCLFACLNANFSNIDNIRWQTNTQNYATVDEAVLVLENDGFANIYAYGLGNRTESHVIWSTNEDKSKYPSMKAWFRVEFCYAVYSRIIENCHVYINV